jgi:hypothetical protein
MADPTLAYFCQKTFEPASMILVNFKDFDVLFCSSAKLIIRCQNIQHEDTQHRSINYDNHCHNLAHYAECRFDESFWLYAECHYEESLQMCQKRFGPLCWMSLYWLSWRPFSPPRVWLAQQTKLDYEYFVSRSQYRKFLCSVVLS